MTEPLIVPQSFGIQKTEGFISRVSYIFRVKQGAKPAPGFVLRIRRIDKIALLNQVLIYKFISYTAERRIFLNPQLDWDRQSLRTFTISGMTDLIDAYVNHTNETKKIIDAYRKLSVDTRRRNEFFIAPHHVGPADEERRVAKEREYFETLRKFYTDTKTRNVVSRVLSEIVNNFWAHANESSGTVLVSQGMSDSLEIVIADNGDGIAETLRRTRDEFRGLSDLEVLEAATMRGTTSKPNTDHMGLGLWLIKRLVQLNGGQMWLYSGEGRYFVSDKKEIRKTGGYWQGSIVFVRIELSSPVSIADIPELEEDANLNIRWVKNES